MAALQRVGHQSKAKTEAKDVYARDLYVHGFDEFGVTVVMFHVGDPSAHGAFNAAAVLQKYG